MLAITAGAARADVDERALLSAYAKARAAGSMGAAGRAAEGYAAVLALSPDNRLLAVRALSQALTAGNYALALSAARILESRETLAPDARLVLLAEALREKKWKAARAYIDQIAQDEVFAFMAPVLRAWVAQASGKGDPIAIIDAAGPDGLAAGYAAEHRPLLLIAEGKERQGVDELLAASDAAAGRNDRLRIAGAATLARNGKRAEALRLVAGDAPPLVAARNRIESRKPVAGAIDGAPAGVANFFTRVAVDLHAQDIDDLALVYARLASFLAPGNSETWLVTSAMLSDKGRHQEALAALANVPPHDPFAPSASDARVRLLAASGRKDEALAQADAAARGAGTVADWARLGDVLSDLERFEEAAGAYEKALDLRQKGALGQAEWALWLMHGGALERAGKWPQAKAALEKAYQLAPDQPLVLNYLGYAQLERRENIDQAMGLIQQASQLRPDSAEITDSLGWAHFLRGDLPAAIKLLERAVAGRPADVEINEHLGDAYYSAGRRYEARYAWKAALLNAEGEDAARLEAKIETGLTPGLASP